MEEDTNAKNKEDSIKGIWFQIMDGNNGKNNARCPIDVQKFLDKFGGVFAEQHKLPPSRNLDHKIKLLKVTKPICVRPYRYPYYKKEEIERL